MTFYTAPKADRKVTVIAIAGTIGSGKSVISSMLQCMGYDVYDTDFNAKRLMDKSELIKRSISDSIDKTLISPEGKIDRRRLAKIVFNDCEKLAALNRLVHGEVFADISLKKQMLEDNYSPLSKARALFVESAITFTSGLNNIADFVWVVTAPEDVRLNRIINRDKCDKTQALSRMMAQAQETSLSQHYLAQKTDNVCAIINDGIAPVLPQLNHLLTYFNLL